MRKRGDPGIEPGTSCTQSKNHTPRPIALYTLQDIYNYTQMKKIDFRIEKMQTG
jgi:hypothetical protein